MAMAKKPVGYAGTADLGDVIAITEANIAATMPQYGGALTALDKPSADNSAMSDYWTQVETIIAGSKAIKAAGKTYLPKFPNEDAANYKFRLECSKFTNVYRDIIEQLSSKPFEETIKVDKAPSQIEEFCNDVDGAGNALSVWAVTSFFNAINYAIDWIFVDYTKSFPEPGRVRSVAEEKAAGLRPYWTRVLAKNVLEVQTAMIGGKKEISYIRILEIANDGTRHVRIITRQNDMVNWFLFRQEIKDGKKVWVQFDGGPITIGVIPLVPIIVGRRNGDTWQFAPPMRDAADLQIELYQEESGLKHISQLTAFPMLSGNGISPPKGPDGTSVLKLATGPSTVLYGPPNPGGGAPGSWSYVEPSSTSLEFLQKKVGLTTEALRELGRQPLTAQSGNLTVVTASVAAGKANSAVAMWAYGLQDAINNALRITALWFGDKSYEPKAEVFTDFDIDGNGDDTTTLNTMRKNRDLSQKTYWHEMQRRGVLSAEFDPDDETQALLDEVPADDPTTMIDALGNPIKKPVGTPPAPGSKPPALPQAA